MKKFLPYWVQWSFNISSTLCLRMARIDSQANTAQMPSFSRMWSEPVLFIRKIHHLERKGINRLGNYPKLSSPHKDNRPASIRLPKYFQPVGTSKQVFFNLAATLSPELWIIMMNYDELWVLMTSLDISNLSTAALVGMLLANPFTPVLWKKGMQSVLLAMTARESEGLTKKAFSPRSILRSCIQLT